MGKRSPHTTDRSELMALLWSASSVSNLFLHGPVLGEDTARKCTKDHVFNRFGSLDGFQREPL